MYPVLHEQAPQRRASLTGRADRAERHRAQCKIQVRGTGDDGRIVAAQLQGRSPKPCRHALPDHAPHGRGAGRRDHRHARTFHHRAAPASRPPVTTTDHAVAANQPKRRVPRPQRDREVEGGDHPHHARRVPLLHQPVVRPFAPQGQTIKLPRQANGQVADVDRTSPRPSETTLPASIDTGRPSTSLFRRNSSRATAPARRAAVRAPSATCRTPCATGWSSP